MTARLETRRSSDGEWLEATVQSNHPSSPFRATARRPLPGRVSPVRHDNVFIAVRSASARGDFETAQIFSGEPDNAEVTSPSYRVGFALENHGGADAERDYQIQCALRCDGGGTRPIVDSLIDVTAVPVEDRPGVTNRCRAWGGAFGGNEQNPAFTSEDALSRGRLHTRDVLRSAVPLHQSPIATEALADFDIPMVWLYGIAPATYQQYVFSAGPDLVRGAILYSSGRLGAPHSSQNDEPWHFPATRLQMGASSDPRSFTIACDLEFDEPWNF